MKGVNRLNRITSGLFLAASLFSTAVLADPPVLPPLPGGLTNVPPAVFCFKVTGGDQLDPVNDLGGARIQFEVLNWTGEDAYEVRITQNEFGVGNTGGRFSEPDPTGTQPNGWYNNPTTGFGDPFYITSFSAFPDEELRGPVGPAVVGGVQPPISFIDLDPNDDLDYSDAPPLPNPVDSGPNVLDGFILEFPDWDVGERIVFQWELLAPFGTPITNGNGVRDPYGFGTFQMDRASNGSIRIAPYFSIGTTLDDVLAYQNSAFPSGVPPVDLGLTDANAIELGPTSLNAAVPLPATAWLMLSGLAGLGTIAAKRKRTVSQFAR